ncbi:PE family protein, partial [Mycobacterium tuberculosis]
AWLKVTVPSTKSIALNRTAAESIGNAIKNLYNAVEPWVQYGFNLTAWAVGWLPYIGILAPQINFFYYLGEPIVQAVLFNAIDFVDGTVTFSQALTNIETATAASINQFINTEINWIRGFLPPLPPISPPGFPSLP